MYATVAGVLNRDVAISQTAAAMIAWFQQQLKPHSAAAGVQPVIAAAPLGSTALHAAAAAVGPQHGLSPATAVDNAASNGAVSAGSSSSSSLLGDRFTDAFQRWVRSPLVAEEVDFRVKTA